MRFLYSISIILLLSFCSNIYAQKEELNITHFSLEEGLSQVSINALLQDKSGYVWIATQDGLNRFDGENFKHYKNQENDSTSISGNLTNVLIEDKNNNIWVGTIGSGISYYNPKLERFYKVKLSNTKDDNETISDLDLDSDGHIWVASRLSGLHKIERKKTNTYSQTSYLKNQSLSAILCDENSVWVGDFKGHIYKINTSTNTSTTSQPEFIINSRVRAFYRTKKYLLIGSDYGLYIYDLETKTLNFFNFEITSQITVKFISAFLKENDTSVWIGSGNGLFLLDINTMKITREIKKTKNNKEGLSNNTVNALLKVDNDKILVGTANNLNLLNFKQAFFKNISKDKRGKHLLNDNVIFSILKDKTDLWVGTSDGGLNLIRNGTPYYFDEVKNDTTKVFGTVREIVKDHKNQRLWVATTRGLRMLNLKTFNPKQPKFTVFRYDPKDENSINGDFLKGIALDQNNHIWGATYGYGVFRLELETNGNTKVTRYVNNPEDKNSLQNNVNSCVRIDIKNNIWIGTQAGLTKLSFKNSNYNNPVFTNYNKDSKQKSSLSHNSIYDILIDKNDSIWIGTRNGLNLFLGNKTFTSWKAQDQFTNAAVYSVQDDNNDNLWLGTNDGLVKFNTKKRKFTQYKLEDGIQSNEFDIHAKFKDNDGTLYIGGIGGITYFNPQEIENIDQPKAIYFSELKIKDNIIKPNNTKGNVLSKSITDSDYLEFKHNQFPFYLEFSSIDFRHYKNVKYGYKLLPTDENWNMLTDSKIQFLNLPPGEYILQINGFSRGKEWDQKPLEMKLNILPPWYKTWLAYFLYLVCVIFIAYEFYRFKISKKLANAEKQKLREIDKLKTKMYANISHEFRTPLTLINGLSKVLLEDDDAKAQNIEKLKGINHNGNQLLHLVNQMLELVSYDANKAKVSYKNANCIQFIEQCVSYYKLYADSKQVELIFSSEILDLKMDFDDDKLQKILNNLLSNAIKFTPEGGVISVKTSTVNQNLIITITDSGKGILAEDLPHIFERHYKTFDLDNNLGNGIGMALTKELVTILDGTISVESKQEKGTIFTIQLPIRNTIKESKTIVYQIPFIENSNTKTTAKNIEGPPNTATILLVEDNKDIQKFIKLLLGNLYKIYTANNGIEGLKIAANKNIDFIISDVMMPKMDGFEFCKHIKSNLKTSHIPFIIISAKTAKEDKIKGHKLGIDAYLFKPFDKDELLLIIKNLLQKKKEQINYFSELLELKESSKNIITNQLDINLIANLQEHVLNKNNKLSMDQLAKSLGTSRTQLHRKIKALTNMSVTNYINHIRIEKAKDLLVNTKLNSSEIAYEVGFESPTYFSRIFKKELEITPVLYRKKHE